MEITIIETGEKKELVIIDPKTRIQWTNDLLGNHAALPDYNDDGTYHIPQDDYDWWYDLINNYQAADNRRHEIICGLDEDASGAMSDELQNINCDLEDLPYCIGQICDKYDKR